MSLAGEARPDFELRPRAVSSYLGAAGWTLAEVAPGSEFWELHETPGRPVRLMLPLDQTYADYARRLHEAIRRLCVVYDWNLDQLATHVAAARSDFMYVRADQASPDGTIPLRQAESLLGGADNLLFFAACSAINPRSEHLGRRPDAAREFVEQDVRMGHTQRGSFVITILTRLDAADELPSYEIADTESSAPESRSSPVSGPEQPSTDTTSPAAESSQITGSAPSQTRLVRIAPFQRRVMSTLAQGLRSARALSLAADQASVEEAIDNGLSANLVSALESMTQHTGLRSLDITFSWAAAEPSPHPAIDTVSVDRNMIPVLPDLRERLRQRPPLPTRVTILGQVTRLERGEGDDIGTVTVTGVTGRSTQRQVRITLTGKAYNDAIRAHRARIPVSATGTLSKHRNAFWLEGPDLQFDAVAP